MPRSKKDTDYLARCRARIDAAAGFRKHEGYDDLWDRLVDLYAGKHWDISMDEGDRFTVNVAFSTINVILPSVSVTRPNIVVQARLPEDEDSATIIQELVNYWWEHYDVLEEFQRAIKDSLILGFGWLKTGYKFVEEEQDDVEAYEAEVAGRIAEADEYAEANPLLADSLPTDEEIESEVSMVTNKVIVEDQPFVEHVPHDDVFVDPEATSMRDARWVAHRVVKSWEEVDDNENYTKKGRDATQADSHQNADWHPTGDWTSEADGKSIEKRVTIWEYHDLLEGIMCVFPEDGDEFLIEPVDQPYAFGQPFYMVRNYDVPKTFYPMGELEALEPLQHELNETRTQMARDRAQFKRKYLYNAKAFDPQGREALESTEDNVFVPVTGNVELDKIVARMPTEQLDPALYQETQVVESDIINVSGVSEYQRGTAQEVRRTATEASIIQDSANARAAHKLANVEKAAGEIGKRLVQLAQQFTDGEQVARITGVNGQPLWFAYDEEDIAGEYDYNVEGGSTQPYNEQQHRQDAIQMLQMLAPFADPQLGLLNIQEIVKYALEDGFGVQNSQRFMAQPVDPTTSALGDESMAAQNEVVAKAQEEEGGGEGTPQESPQGGMLPPPQALGPGPGMEGAPGNGPEEAELLAMMAQMGAPNGQGQGF